jgi:hypothetical protein
MTQEENMKKYLNNKLLKRYTKQILVFFILYFVVLIGTTNAASTSNWIHIKSSIDDTFKNMSIENGSKYITIKFVNSRIYHKSNWWSDLIGKDRVAVISLDLIVNHPYGTLQDRRTSPQIKIERRTEPVDLGWSQYIVKNMPTTFTSLNLNVSLGSTAKDGLEDIISFASEISKTTPTIGLSQARMEIVSASKQIADLLFGKELIKNYLNSTDELISTGTITRTPGFYVIFGGDNANQYAKYINNKDQLFWDNNSLKFNSKEIIDVNYFIISIESIDKIYPKKDLNLLSDVKRPWVSLYIKANELIAAMKMDELDSTGVKVRELIANANILLDADLEYIFVEKMEIYETIRKDLLKYYYQRKAELEAANPPPFK